MSDIIEVLYTTVGTEAEAEKLANLAIANKMAACVNILGGGRSIYRWEEKVEQSNEYYMLFKTTAERLFALEQFIIQNHPYDVPAILKWQCQSSLAFYDYVNALLL